jgi:hypothetical protein
MSNKTVHKKRDRSTNAQKQYVRGIVHNLSLQRWTDQEIVDYLRTEKKIDLARITINGIRRNIEKQAAKWYIELKQSQNKYIANYKERLDSLLSYQKILHGIITTTKREEIKIRAISELTTIEMHIFNLWKQLPELDISDRVKQPQQSEEEDGYENTQIPPVDDKEERARFDQWDHEARPMSRQYRDRMEARYGVTIEPWDKPPWVQCGWCQRWFKNQWQKIDHEDTCLEKLNEAVF